MGQVWIEKYRPKELEEIVGNSAVVEVFKVFAAEESMPHLILTGAPGIGKTTLVGCLLNRVIKDPQQRKEAVLEMNASDERGVEVVRTKIKLFLQKKVLGTRFLVLDESDAMTNAAQQSMRRLLEIHTDAKFVFVCNDISKVADTIQSRCAILRLAPLTGEEIRTIVERVCTSEGIEISGASAALIAETAEGDARQAINFLQTLAAISKRVDHELVEKMTHVPPIALVQEMVAADTARGARVAALNALVEDGYALEDIAKMVFKLGKDGNDVGLLDKAARLLLKLADSPAKAHFYAMVLEERQ